MSSSKNCTRNKRPIKAYKDLDFLHTDAARQIRVLCEMTEPGLRFDTEKIKDTIVLFGSARTRPPEIAAAEMERIQSGIKNPDNLTLEEERALHFAECNMRSAKYYTEAVDLAKEMTNWSMNLPNHPLRRFIICSGGGPGIMEAANRGADSVDGKSIGLGISLPFEQTVNKYVPESLKFEFHYFFVRKFWFVSMAKAIVAFPGGFGTLDELFETLTLIQTEKVGHATPVILFGSEFWNEIINFDALVKWGMISPEDVNLFKIIDTVEDARDYLIEQLTEGFINKPEATL